MNNIICIIFFGYKKNMNANIEEYPKCSKNLDVDLEI